MPRPLFSQPTKQQTNVLNLHTAAPAKTETKNEEQQMQMARAKVQEHTPAFTQIQPATVPLKKDGPKRMTIVLAFMFFAFVLTSIHVLIQDAKKNNA